ncbi:MAG: hypothetical protein ACPG6B_04345, partial [Oceanihabitans sp.]
TFQLSGNNVNSKPYTLQVIEAPTLLSFDMHLDYPSHTKKQDETLNSTGNAIVPQGTKISWVLHTKATSKVHLFANDTLTFSSVEPDVFKLSKRVFNTLKYNLATSNASLKNYENLAFNIDVVRDEYPELKLKVKVDSLDQQSLYFYGQVSDDYGIKKLQLVYYPTNEEQNKQIENIPISTSTFSEFISAFPNNLKIEEGVSYELYFTVQDNDILNKYKTTKSEVYTYRKRTKDEEEQKQLQQQNETIQDLNKSLEKMEEREKELKEISKTQKEKAELNFNDKRKLENFLKRQKQQEEMMQNFNKKLKENLEEFQKDKEEKDIFKEDLKERLKQNEEQLKQDEKLLEELQKLQEKINKEELNEKLEKLAKQSKNQKRSLEQLLEMTKRYYVAKKLEKLQQELEQLAKEQEELSKKEGPENTKEKQEALNKKFEDFQKEMEELNKENNKLKQPKALPTNKEEEESIKKDMDSAKEKLDEKQKSSDQEKQKQNESGAQQKQKQAAQKMKKMSSQMMQSMMQGAQSGEQEDIETLRQILDNLLLFSFDQEALMKNFKTIDENHNKFANYLRKQHHLREHFSHIDDSLFALSLRQPKISEKINKEITEVFFNIDKSLSQFSDNKIPHGIANQQYTITASNNLANMLSNALNSMQMQMMSSGQGQGKPEPGLPDIIKSQEELNQEMQGNMPKSGEGKPKPGEGKPKEGEGDKQGEKDGDKKGEKGKGKKPGEEGKQSGEGEGNSEELNGEIYEIYQKQQQIRQALQDKLAKEGATPLGNKLLKDMEQVEMELLNNGITNQTLQKMMQLQHQLLKLKNATFQQGQEEKRESQTNKKSFKNATNNQIPTAKQYFNTTEILKRQSLPLQPAYKKKVQEYFKQKND